MNHSSRSLQLRQSLPRSRRSHGSRVRRQQHITTSRQQWVKNHIISGRGGLITADQHKFKLASTRAGMPALDRSTYLETSPDGSPQREITLYPGGFEVSGNVGPLPNRESGGKFELKPNARKGGGLRGKVRGKSRQSRRRQMQLMMKVRPPGPGYFTTLTLPDAPLRLGWSSQRVLDALKGDNGWLVRFSKAVFYRWPGATIMWGEELQDRKSGDFKGAVMPHMHCIIFGVNPAELSEEFDDFCYGQRDYTKSKDTMKLQGWVKRTWYEICGFHDKDHFLRGADVQELDSRRKVLTYISKYTGKEQTCGYDDETGEVLETGRMWGVMYGPEAKDPETGKPYILHEGIKVITSDDELVQLKRLIKRWLRARGKSGQKYGRWLTTNSEGKRWSLFGLGLDDMGGCGADLSLPPNDRRAHLRFESLLDQCFECNIREGKKWVKRARGSSTTVLRKIVRWRERHAERSSGLRVPIAERDWRYWNVRKIAKRGAARRAVVIKSS